MSDKIQTDEMQEDLQEIFSDAIKQASDKNRVEIPLLPELTPVFWHNDDNPQFNHPASVATRNAFAQAARQQNYSLSIGWAAPDMRQCVPVLVLTKRTRYGD